MTIIYIASSTHVKPPIEFSYKLISHIRYDVQIDSKYMGMYSGIQHISTTGSHQITMIRRRLFTDYVDGTYNDIYY
jgi:hypothetical protein